MVGADEEVPDGAVEGEAGAEPVGGNEGEIAEARFEAAGAGGAASGDDGGAIAGNGGQRAEAAVMSDMSPSGTGMFHRPIR